VDPAGLSPAALERLLDHPLPGNVRELENILERALIVSGGGRIEAEQIPSPSRPAGANALPDMQIPDEGLVLEELEKKLILGALAKAQGNKSRAAALLGLTRRTLYSRMEKHGLRG